MLTRSGQPLRYSTPGRCKVKLAGFLGHRRDFAATTSVGEKRLSVDSIEYTYLTD